VLVIYTIAEYEKSVDIQPESDKYAHTAVSDLFMLQLV